MELCLPFAQTLHDPLIIGNPFGLTLVKEKIILKLVKMIRKALIQTIVTGGVKTVAVGKLLGSILNTTRISGVL